MAEVNFNVIPYNDDFDPNKSFYKILFRPSYAVQARELTQVQSILQNQIKSVGEHLFKDGAMVIPGSLTINKEYEYVRLQAFSTSKVADLIGSKIRGFITGIEATVINAVEAENDDPPTLFVKYLNDSDELDGQTVPRFEQNEILIGIDVNGNTISCHVEAEHLNDFLLVAGQGSSVSIEEGVYFINGYFVKNNAETIILDKYFNFPSYKIGFLVQQSFINSFNDDSLYDNATGSSNLNAPGADRYSISVSMQKRNINDADETDFVTLATVDGGQIEQIINKTEYNILEKELATRTYEESGNYVVNNFDIEVIEHKNNGVNGGRWPANDDGKYEFIYTEEESDKLLAVGLENGKAYIEGFRHTPPKKHITISKAREIETVENSPLRLKIGNSITVTNSYGIPDVGDVSGIMIPYPDLILYKATTVERGTANAGSGTSLNEIGRAKPRFYEYQSGTIGGTGLFGTTPISTTITATGSATYTLNTSLTDGSDVTVKVDNILKTEGVDYTISGTTLTFLNTSPSSPSVIEAKQHTDVYKLGLFDIKFFTHLEVGVATLNSAPGYSYSLNTGKKLTGLTSGATGIIEVNSTANDLTAGTFILSNVSGTFEFEDVIDDDGNVFGVALVSQYSIKDIRQIYMASASLPFTADVVLSSSGDAFISDTEYTCPVFKLPQQVVKTLKTEIRGGVADTIHKVRRVFADTVDSGGSIAFTVPVNESFDSFLTGDYVLTIVSSGTGNGGSPGDIIDLTGIHTLESPFRQFTVDLGSDYSGAVVKFIGTVTKSVTAEKTKKLITGQTVASSGTADEIFDRATSSVISLGVADVFRLNSVYMSNDFNTPVDLINNPSGATNITDRFTLDDGQRESFYDIGRIIRKPGIDPPTGRLLINFDYFDHLGAGDYFSVDSYDGVVDYSQIPVFNSATKGKLYLRDCIDFRPRVSNTSNVIGYDGDASNAKNFTTSSGASLVEFPKPESDLFCDFEFYLARIDSIGINPGGQYKVSRGEASLDPQLPTLLESVMILYYLYLPPYTFKTSDVKINPVDNRRFTMRDIAKLERRIKNIEYYTQLSLLEQSAINTQIPDASGVDRFKNGVLVDTFKGHNVADVTSIDHQCSIDMMESELRPSFSQQLIEMEEDSTITDADRLNAGYRKTGDLITLPYTDVAFTGNPFSSKFVNCNPYVVFQYAGEVTLTPSIDEWRDVNRRPDLIVNNNNLFDTFSEFAAGDSLGTVWNGWQNTWSGTSSTINSFSGDIDVNTVIDRTTTTLTRTGTLRELSGSIQQNSSFGDRVIDTSFISFIRTRTIAFRGTRLRPNTRVYPFFDGRDVSQYCTNSSGVSGGSLITDSFGEVNGTFTIPNTDTLRFRTGDRVFRLTSSADNADSTADTNDEVTTFGEGTYTARGLLTTNETTIQSTRVPIINSTTVTETDTRVTIDNVSVNATATNILNDISNLQDVTEQNTNSINNLNQAVANNTQLINQNRDAIQSNTANISSLAGQLSNVQNTVGSIQNTVAIQGETLSNVQSDISAVQGDVNNLSGLVSNVQNTVGQLQNRTNALSGAVMAQGMAISRLNNRVFPPRRTDPVAQTFFINESGGCFVTKVDLYFRKKDNNIPIRIYLTSTLAGRPTENILPFSDIVLKPADINVSTDATAITTVTFPSPVYLQTNQEYALVLRPNSQEYEVWVSRLGQNQLNTTERITVQPLLGSFFRSQNASLWTEDQYEDLTFTMYRADFVTNTFGNIDLQNSEIPVDELGPNPVATNTTIPVDGNGDPLLGTTFGTNPAILRVTHKNHGMNSSTPSKVTIAGFTDAESYNGILGSAINGTHDIGNVTIDTYTITLPDADVANISSTGLIGDSGITATQEINFQVLQPQIGELVYDNTKVKHSIKTTSARSPQGQESPYVRNSTFKSIVPNDNFYFTSNRSVLSTINETSHLAGEKSLIYRISMATFNSNISPVLDLQRVNLFAINNRLNSPLSTLDTYIPETAGQGGSAVAKYITKEVVLNNPSTAIDLRLSASVYSSSSIEVYYKLRITEDSRLLSDIPFAQFAPTNNPPNSEDRSQSPYNENYKKDFSEYKFFAEGLQEFTSFQIKIVMKGSNPAYPPRITDLRAIALAL